MRALVGIAAAALALIPASAHAQGPAEPFDGTIPFDCVLQQAGTEAEFPDPDADPFCVEYDKRHQNVSRARRRRVPLARAGARGGRDAEVLLLPARPLGRVDRPGRRPHRDLLVGRLVLLRQGEGRGRRLRRELHGQQPERRPDARCPASPRSGSPTSATGAAASTRPGTVDADPTCVAKAEEKSPYRARAGAGAAAARLPGGRGQRRPLDRRPRARRDPRARRSTRNGEPLRRKRGFLRYCVHRRRQVHGRVRRSGRAEFLLTSNPGFDVNGVRRLTPARQARRRLKGERSSSGPRRRWSGRSRGATTCCSSSYARAAWRRSRRAVRGLGRKRLNRLLQGLEIGRYT